MRNILLAATFALSPICLLAGPVDLNKADAETIARELNGVGTARAQAIVEYRDEFGEFRSEEELLNVTGIGRHILDVNRSNIVLSRKDD